MKVLVSFIGKNNFVACDVSLQGLTKRSDRYQTIINCTEKKLLETFILQNILLSLIYQGIKPNTWGTKWSVHVYVSKIRKNYKAFHSPSKQSWFEITIVLIVIVNGTAKEPLRCVVVSFSFSFICWHSISMSSDSVELSRIRFPTKLSRAVSVSRKQSKQARSIGGLVWLVIKIVIGRKEWVLLQWSVTLDIILIVLITKGMPC